MAVDIIDKFKFSTNCSQEEFHGPEWKKWCSIYESNYPKLKKITEIFDGFDAELIQMIAMEKFKNEMIKLDENDNATLTMNKTNIKISIKVDKKKKTRINKRN
jgi:hypothetical protein